MRETQVIKSKNILRKWPLSSPLHQTGKSSQAHGSQLNSLITVANRLKREVQLD